MLIVPTQGHLAHLAIVHYRVEDAKAAARTTIAQAVLNVVRLEACVRQHVRVMKIALPGDDV